MTEPKAVALQKFIDDNKPRYNEMIWIYEELFNKIGVETNDEPLQLAFTGTIIFNLLNSIQCGKRQKQQLLRNILAKI